MHRGGLPAKQPDRAGDPAMPDGTIDVKGDVVDAFLAVVIAANPTHGERRGGVIVQLAADVA